ncbi:CLUMA_CG019741, isoform A [Clunio marinus]|uniref:CLUMA_CG019741, isoform A n=1 Tax=Clunio marinus TaxID=568069 RepID=A0A1J1J507_9DIPT|nr:CLUMA_CG019741, isoform A [Clunio marinus]
MFCCKNQTKDGLDLEDFREVKKAFKERQLLPIPNKKFNIFTALLKESSKYETNIKKNLVIAFKGCLSKGVYK